MEPTKNQAHRTKNLSECAPPSQSVESLNLDDVPNYCDDPVGEPLCGGKFSDSQKRVATELDLSWLQDIAIAQKTGFGQDHTCDPVQKGHIVNQTESRSYVYRYNRALRGCNEAMLDMFRDLVVIDDFGQAHAIPIVWGRQEKAVALVLQDNVKEDGSVTLDRLRLPMMAIHSDDVNFDASRYIYHKARRYYRGLRPDGKPGFTAREKFERDTIFSVSMGIPVDITYTMYAWTLYEEDMLQIIEQVIPKIAPMGYISVRGVQWETVVTLEGSANNMDNEPCDLAERIIKYQ